MRMLGRVAGIVAGAVLGACAKPGYVYTKTGEAGLAKPPNCDFVIATTKVDHPYTEVGILDSQESPAQDAADFKDRVRVQTCEVGGDAVIAEVSGTGSYIRGTIVRYTESESSAAGAPAGPTE